MAEPYSDEELELFVPRTRLGATIARLQRERDDALLSLADTTGLIAITRREALEEAAVVAETFDDWATNEHFLQSRKHIARRIRALKDKP